MLYFLSVNDFKTKYAGSYLGVIWAFVQPVVTVLIYWFVFEVGFRSGSVHSVPFILWLVAGIVPWFFLLRLGKRDKLSDGVQLLSEKNSFSN